MLPAIYGNRRADGCAAVAGFNLKPAPNESYSLLHAGDADAQPKRGAGSSWQLPMGSPWTLIADFQLNFVRASIQLYRCAVTL